MPLKPTGSSESGLPPPLLLRSAEYHFLVAVLCSPELVTAWIPKLGAAVKEQMARALRVNRAEAGNLQIGESGPVDRPTAKSN
jgi:hypothetical protein